MFERYNVWPMYADVAATLLALIAFMGIGVMFSSGTGGYYCVSPKDAFQSNDNSPEAIPENFDQLKLSDLTAGNCTFSAGFSRKADMREQNTKGFMRYLTFESGQAIQKQPSDGLSQFCRAYGTVLNAAAKKWQSLDQELQSRYNPEFVVMGHASGEWQKELRGFPKNHRWAPARCHVQDEDGNLFFPLVRAVQAKFVRENYCQSPIEPEFVPVCACYNGRYQDVEQCIVQRESYRMTCNRMLSYRRALWVQNKCEVQWRDDKSAPNVDDEVIKNMIRIEGAGATDTAVRAGFTPEGQRRVTLSIREPQPMDGL